LLRMVGERFERRREVASNSGRKTDGIRRVSEDKKNGVLVPDMYVRTKGPNKKVL